MQTAVKRRSTISGDGFDQAQAACRYQGDGTTIDKIVGLLSRADA